MAGRWGELSRRLWVDLVRRRSRARVAPAPTGLPARPREAPIFLVGAYRSGTTLLRYVFDSHSRLCCPPESEFLAPLAQLVRDEQSVNGLAGLGWSRDQVEEEVARLASTFFAGYAATAGKPRWVDKSPRYVEHLEGIRRLFPEARFLQLYRHGLDVADSLTRGGSFAHPVLGPALGDEDLRLSAVRWWIAQVRAQQAFVRRHPEGCRELTYEALCRDPEASLRPLFAAVGEDWEEGVLEYWRFPHDVGREAGRVGATRGFDGVHGRWRSWQGPLRRHAFDLAGETLEALGYELE